MEKKDYTKFSNVIKPVEAETVSDVKPIVKPEIKPGPVMVEKPKLGVVTDCVKLNVRKKPHANATIVTTITCETELEIIEAESTKDFYKICTAAGVEGFCMKRFISILP